MPNDAQVPAATPLETTRKRWLALIIGVFAAIGIAYGAYWAIALRYSQSTDDAYVSGNVVQITPQISGTVVAIGADDTEFVKAGDLLVRLDQADSLPPAPSRYWHWCWPCVRTSTPMPTLRP